MCFASLAACIYCRLAVALPPSHFCCRHGALCTACASLAIGRRSSVDFGRLSPPVRIYPQGAGPLRFLKLRGGQETDKESSIVAEFDDDSLRAEVFLLTASFCSNMPGKKFLSPVRPAAVAMCPESFRTCYLEVNMCSALSNCSAMVCVRMDGLLEK